MQYTKPPLNFEDQAALLLRRGLQDIEKPELVEFLHMVNYYRLSGYLYTFKSTDPITGDECFVPGTSFIVVKQRYEFDRSLRLLLMNAIERIEVAILRTQLVEAHALMYGPFGYTSIKNYNPHFSNQSFSKLIKDIQRDEKGSREEFIKRYRSKYNSEPYLPLWMATELMSFGQSFTLYRNSDMKLKRTVAGKYGLLPVIFDSWLHTLNYVRNACAHHVRLWNRPIPIAPKIPDKKNYPDWYIPVAINNSRIFSVLTICQYLLNQLNLDGSWKNTIIELLAANPHVPANVMGFPMNWQDSKIWTPK